MEYCVRHLDARGLIAALPSWVDSQIYLDAHKDSVRQSGPENPAYGEIDPATPEQLQGERAKFSAEDALLAFGIMAALENQMAALSALGEGASDIAAGYAGKEILEIVRSGESKAENLLPYVATQIHHVTHHPDLTPDELFVACVRFVQWARKSNLQRVLTLAVEMWARSKWARAIEEQRFNLRNPVTGVPAIRDALAANMKGLTFLGKLLIAAEPAMHTKFPPDFRNYLRSL
jgi:hypothetical protein